MRTRVDPANVVPQVKAAIWSVNPEQRLTRKSPRSREYMDRLIAQRRFNMALLVLFGVLGLVITAAGIYGAMAYGRTAHWGKSASGWRSARARVACCRWCCRKPRG